MDWCSHLFRTLNSCKLSSKIHFCWLLITFSLSLSLLLLLLLLLLFILYVSLKKKCFFFLPKCLLYFRYYLKNKQECIIRFKNSRHLIIHNSKFFEWLQNLPCRSTNFCTNIYIWGQFGPKNWTLSLVMSLSDIKTLIKH